MTKWIIVRWLTDSKKEIDLTVDALLEDRLIACANIHSNVESRYHWKGSVDSCTEYEVQMKTRAKHWESIANYIRKHSSYETPALMAVPLENVIDSYEKWMEEEISS